MKFTYETQGAISYLVCELEATEQLDSLTLGMLTNNHISGLAPVLYTEMNGQRFLKYNISAKIASNQFFGGSIRKQRALQAFENILNAICSADEYMIDANCFSVIPEHVFLNVSSCETALICVPVMSDRNINQETAALFKNIMFSAQFDSTEDASYITQLLTYINDIASFTVYGLRDLVKQLISGAAVAPPVPQVQPSVQVSAFDSTVSIDDMPALMQQSQAVQVNPVPVQPAPTPVQPIPAPASAQPRSEVRPPVPQPSVPQPPVPQPPVPQPPVPQPPVPQPKPPVVKPPMPAPTVTPAPQAPAPVPPVPPKKPQMQNNPGFAIPGQAAGGVVKPPVPAPIAQAAPAADQSNQAPADGKKKMSIFGLLTNYSKENAELYKKQKEEKKAEKATAKSVSVPATNGMPKPGQPNAAGAPMGGASAQPFVAPQPPVQPIPVQNSFNETTVLSPSMIGGETTVLSANPGMPDPHLIRIKSGEKISINKPVFRIGKEKSYVDYFIADNTAISRSHANIHTDNGEYYVEDTNSTNHTYVNGEVITSNMKVKIVSGDKIRLANEEFLFSV